MQRLVTAVEPVVQHGVRELQQGEPVVHTMREVALMGALVGAGAGAATAISQVEQAEATLFGRGTGEAWEYGAMPTMPYGKGAATMPYGAGAAMPYGKGMTMPYGKGAAMPYGAGAAMPYGKGMTMPYGKGAAMPYGKGMPTQYGMGATPMMTKMPLGWR